MNPTILCLIAIAATSAVFIILIIVLRRKDRIKIAEVEQRLLLSQMNPHFVFNSLTAIQSYIFRNEPHLAGRYMSNFAKLVRLILENSRTEFISIRREVDTLNYYLELQGLRFEDKFEFNIFVDDEIDQRHHALPPMLAQPFIENAIEHGVIHLGEKGRIDIRFKLNDNSITLEVEDNGVGIETIPQRGHRKWKEYQSLATRITRERIANLHRAKGYRVRMQVVDLSKHTKGEETGTLIRFFIPLKIIS